MPRLSGRHCRMLFVSALSLTLLAVLGAAFVSSAESPRPTPTPLATLGGEEVDPQGVGGKFPDLIVSSIVVTPAQPLKLQQAVVEVVITNQGDVQVAAGNNFFVDLYVDPDAPPERGCPDTAGRPGDYSWGIQGDWMKAGTSLVLTADLTFTDTRTYDFYAQVDTDCDVVETDEYNNIAGPVKVWVRTAQCFRQDSHPDFQYGFSNLDISHPDGVVYLKGGYSVAEPIDSIAGVPALDHRPDTMVNDAVYTPLLGGPAVTDSSRQEMPVMVNGPDDHLYIAWQDGRNGNLYNRDVYFAYSTDGGSTWSQDIRVNQDSPTTEANQEAPDLAFDASSSMLYAVWQDGRSGNYDIYLARSANGGQTWQEPAGNPINDDLRAANQLHPSVAVEDGTVYVAWQDERNGNSHIYVAWSGDAGVSWSQNVFASDDPESSEMTEQWQTSPSLVVYDGTVYVVWEDQYSEDPSDIYYVWGKPCADAGCDSLCFDVPIRVNRDPVGAVQRQPAIAVHHVLASAERSERLPDPQDPTQLIDVKCYDAYEGSAIHFAWQDFRAGPDDPDIYYAWAFDLDFDQVADLGLPNPRCQSLPGVDNPFGDDYEVLGNKQVNSKEAELQQPADDGCHHPQDEPWGDYQGADWQEHPTMLVRGDGVYIGWSDGWSFDDYWNYDIWLADTHRANLESGDYVIEPGWIVNDNVKVHSYMNGPAYTTFGPAAARQSHPTLAVCAGLPCVAWDDNRRGDPLAGGICNQDIYVARPTSTLTEGVYISPIFDAGTTDATWYVMDWMATTPYCGKLTFQTRMGNTSWPDSTWTDWTGATQWNGEWVYDAPGQHIVDEWQNLYPQSRYIQYRAQLTSCTGSGGSPQLYSVTIYHNHPQIGPTGPTSHRVFLPMTWKN